MKPHRRLRHFLLILITFLHLVLAQAEVGYGPGFGACGDNCQTALRIFCTEDRDAAQQTECWCVLPEYNERLEACLSTCDPSVSDISMQRELMQRFRNVVCKGSAEGDVDFSRYYSTRYGGSFVPMATKAAPPAVVPEIAVVTSSTMSSETTMRTRSRDTFFTRIRTRTRTRSSSTPITSSTASPTRSSPGKSSRTATTSMAKQSSATPSTSTSDLPASTSKTSNTTFTSSPSSSSSATPDSGLDALAIAGISAVSVMSFIALLLFGAFLARRRWRQRPISKTPENPTAPDGNWPPPSMIQRRESVYYSPDDISGAMAGTMVTGGGAGGSGFGASAAGGGTGGAGWVGIPGVRIIAPTPSPPPTDAGTPVGSSGTEMEISCSDSSSRSSEWTDYDPDSESYVEDSGRGGYWDIRASSREERVYPEEEEYYGMAVGSPREAPAEYHPGRRWAGS